MLHSSRSLRVSDPVEYRLSHTGVDHWPPNRVGGYHLVLHVAPRFSLHKGGHARLVADCLATCSDLLQTEVGDEVGKALIEPDVIPPRHSDQVAEPVMRKLVGNSVGEIEHALSGDLLLPDVQVIESDNPRVLHGAPLVLVGKDLVVFGEGEIVPEELLIELH